MKRRRFHERGAVFASISKLRGTVEFRPAYSGGYLYTEDNGEYPTVIDLATCTLEPDIPILVEHRHEDWSDIAGYVTGIRIEGNQIHATGQLGQTPAAERVKEGCATFRWKPSIGAMYRWSNPQEQKIFIPEGEVVRVNGRDLIGPFTLAKHTYLSEISMVGLPGDAEAVAVVASMTRGGTMTFEEFLASKEITQEQFDAKSSEEQDALRAEFDALSSGDPGVSAEGDETAVVQEVVDAGNELLDVIEQVGDGELPVEEAAPMIAEEAAQVEEIADAVLEEVTPAAEAEACDPDEEKDEKDALKAALRKAAQAGFQAGRASGKRPTAAKARIRISPKMQRKAIEASRRFQAAKAKLIPSLSRGVGSGQPGGPTASQILLAQYAASAGLPDSAMKYLFMRRGGSRSPADLRAAQQVAERAVNAAIDTGRYGPGRVCTRELIDRTLTTHRQSPTNYSDSAKGVITRWRDLYKTTAVHASLSTFDAMDALNVILQAFVMDTLDTAEPTYRTITREQVVRDFGETQMVRVNLLGRLRELSETGKLPQLKTNAEKMALNTKNNGAAVTISLMDLINDTLGLFSDIAGQCVSVAEGCIEADVYETFGGLIAGTTNAQDGNAFFSSSRGNLLEGSAYALSNGVSALSAANRLFKKFKNANGGYLANTAAIMLTGTANYDYALQVYESQGLTALSERGDKNIFFNRYQPIDTPYLDADEYGSDTVWFMLADPARRPFLIVTKMAGFESPVVNQVDRPIWDEESIGYTIDYPYGINVMHPDAIVQVTGVSDDDTSSSGS